MRNHANPWFRPTAEERAAKIATWCIDCQQYHLERTETRDATFIRCPKTGKEWGTSIHCRF